MSNYPDIRLLKKPNKWLKARLNILGEKGDDERTRLWVSTTFGLTGIVGAALTAGLMPPIALLSAVTGVSSLLCCVAADFGSTGKIRLYSLTVSDASRLANNLTRNKLPQGEEEGIVYQETMQTVDQNGRRVRSNDRRSSLEVASDFLSSEEAYEAVFVERNRVAIAKYLESIPPEIKENGFENYENRFDAYLDMCAEVFDDQEDQISDYYDILDAIAAQHMMVTHEVTPNFPSSSSQRQSIQSLGVTPAQPQRVIQQDYSSYRQAFNPQPLQSEPTDLQVTSPIYSPEIHRTGYQIFLDLVDSTCCYVAGGQQSGKTLLLAETTKVKASEGVVVFYVNLFTQDLDKDGRWSHVHDSRKIETDISLLKMGEACKVAQLAVQLLREFERLVFKEKKDAIFVWDEIELSADKSSEERKGFMKSVMSLLSDLIARLTGFGVKSGGAIHVLSPGYAANVFFPNVNARTKKMVPIICSVNKGKFVTTRNGKKITFNSSLLQQMLNNFKKGVTVDVPLDISTLKTDRIFQWDGEWYELGGSNDLPEISATPSQQNQSAPVDSAAQRLRQRSSKQAQKKMPEPLAAIVEELENVEHDSLWDLVVDSTGIAEPEKVKRILTCIGKLIENDDRLSHKFSEDGDFLRSDVTVMYKGRHKKVEETLNLTENTCCLCQEEATNVHNTDFRGPFDIPGKNMVTVCDRCYETCYEEQNWIEDNANPWNSRQRDKKTKKGDRALLDRIQVGMNYLTTEAKDR
ncbi:MAG: hypothetical protein F6K26_03400 [Moorea sp. SIO2I5]|nr:hypothetical protein [Moorena sp. SIO2I5]